MVERPRRAGWLSCATVLLGGMIALVVLSACSGGGDSSTAPIDLRRAWTSSGMTPNPYQEKIIADGRITAAEYAAAVEDQRQCVVEAGYDAGPIKTLKDGLLKRFSFSTQGSDDAVVSAGLAVVDSCALEFTQPLEMAYQEQNLLRGAERDDGYRDLAKCMSDAGAPGVEVGMTQEEIGTVASRAGDGQAVHDCLDEMLSRLFSVLPPGGDNEQ